MIQFRCEHCDVGLRVPETHAGKQARCPRCKGRITVPQTPATPIEPQGTRTVSPPHPPEDTLPDPSAAQPTATNATTDSQDDSQSGWRVLLYPLNVSGIIHLLIFALLPPLWAQTVTLRFWESSGIGTLFCLVLGTLYFIHYTATCLSDSAAGGMRAADINSASTPLSVDALISTGETILPAVALIWGPAFAYYLIKEQIDWILLTWLAIAGSAFPMIILAVNDFDSIRAASPLLVVPSIASVFCPYCVLVGCLLVLAALVGLLLYLSVGPTGVWFLRPPAFYLFLLATHILGRFYYRHRERLNWGA